MTKLSDAWFYRLKAAQIDLIDMSGGIEKTADKTSMSKSQVGRWRNRKDPDLITLPAALALEAECGVPVVTNVMAELNGRRLADPDQREESAACVLTQDAELGLAFAGLGSAKAVALADLNITPNEAAGLDKHLSRIERETAEYRKTLAGIMGRTTKFAVVNGGEE